MKSGREIEVKKTIYKQDGGEMNQSNKNKENQYYEHKPIREFKATLSKDGKFWLFKDITTHVVPRSYISKIESSSGEKPAKKPQSKSRSSNNKVE